MLFFVSWYEPFYLELIPPINVKKVTQVFVKPDGTELKAGQTIREFSRSGQLIKYYEIVHGPYYAGPYKDSVIANLPTIGHLNAEGKVSFYDTPGAQMGFSLSSQVVYHPDGSISYTSEGDSSYCVFDKLGKILSRTIYNKLSDIGKPQQKFKSR